MRFRIEGDEGTSADEDLDPSLRTEPLDMTEEEALADIPDSTEDDVDSEWEDSDDVPDGSGSSQEGDLLELEPSDEIEADDTGVDDKASAEQEDNVEESRQFSEDDALDPVAPLELKPEDAASPDEEEDDDDFSNG